MNFPDFIQKFPALDLPFGEDVVQSRVVRSDAGLVVFFTFLQDVDLPPHSHLAQWGILVNGSMEMTIDGVTRICKPGDTWDIPAHTEHGAKIIAGSMVIDVFEEPDRYPLKPS